MSFLNPSQPWYKPAYLSLGPLPIGTILLMIPCHHIYQRAPWAAVQSSALATASQKGEQSVRSWMFGDESSSNLVTVGFQHAKQTIYATLVTIHPVVFE